MPVLGMAVLLGIAVLFSSNRKAIRIRTVALAFTIQITIGAVVLFTSWGTKALSWLAKQVQKVIDTANSGIEFMFGGLVSENSNLGFVFAFHVLPVIIFFSSLIAVLYHFGIIQIVIKTIGGALRKALGTSKVESLSATANIFVGQTEAPIVVKPYLSRVTKSELFAIMVGGLASIDG